MQQSVNVMDREVQMSEIRIIGSDASIKLPATPVHLTCGRDRAHRPVVAMRWPDAAADNQAAREPKPMPVFLWDGHSPKPSPVVDSATGETLSAHTVAVSGSQVDAVLVPEGGSGAGAVAAALRGAGIATGQVQLLGTGQWDDPAIAGDPNLAGALYPAPERGAYETYLGKYRARFGSVPPRTASLAYDGATLAVGLVKARGSGAFTEQVIANPSGFIGVNGLFRFDPNGLSQRGLAVYQVNGGAVRVISPAPRSFGAGS
jgi:hypothetical protein